MLYHTIFLLANVAKERPPQSNNIRTLIHLIAEGMRKNIGLRNVVRTTMNLMYFSRSIRRLKDLKILV